VLGTAPGIGKSTLCAALARWLPARGRSVDHFREEEILTRREFAAVATEFRAGGPVRLETLLAAVADFVSSAEADVVIADSLVPFVPSLRAWGYPEETIARFLDDLAAVLTPVVLYLDGDPLTALPRAAAREDPSWLHWFLDKLAHYPGSAVHDLPSAAAYLSRERDLILRLLAAQPWDVLVIDEGNPDTVFRTAQNALTAFV
jgi:thymidylate kinase